MNKTRLGDPPLNIVLVEPQIPPNTGNIARLCAGAGCHMILVGELGFELNDSTLKRAGLDYWEFVSWEHIPELGDLMGAATTGAFHFLTTHSQRPYTELPAARGDYLVFGKETAGLPGTLLDQYPRQCYTIPLAEAGVRSLNLSSAVAIVAYDVLRRVRPFHRENAGASSPAQRRANSIESQL